MAAGVTQWTIFIGDGDVRKTNDDDHSPNNDDH
jgi:hypothetical protein